MTTERKSEFLASNPTQDHPRKLLIVDDDKEILSAMTSLFEFQNSYDIRTAMDAFSVKRLIGEFTPEIALLDIKLKNSSGLELISLLRKNVPGIVCIMMTAYRDINYAVKALRYGADDYLFKPIEPEKLLDIVDQFLANRHRLNDQHKSLQHMSTMFQSTSEFLVLLEPEGRVLETTDSALEMAGLDKTAIAGMPFWEVPWWKHSQSSIEQFKHAMEEAASHKTVRMEIETSMGDEDTGFFELSIKPVVTRSNTATHILVEGHDVTERKKIENGLRELALQDYLTGLPNRVHFYQRLQSEISMAMRHRQNFAVLYLDVDGFKNINDQLGHPVGDRVLEESGKRIKECLREGDLLARIGGDEFAIILRKTEGVESIRIVNQRIINAMSTPFFIDDKVANVSISVGVTMFPDDGRDPEYLLAMADKAMYLAKKNGKNQFRFFQ